MALLAPGVLRVPLEACTGGEVTRQPDVEVELLRADGEGTRTTLRWQGMVLAC